ncbi:hypothetical protein Sste5346_003323 [Sporothrix stenoceras]|uniref:Ima1 N-terminal domain-containing protein n=1 Tax=Sporothrix stenoceras TaxID=5173 RepID=A0ABR3ZF34_9PEZI
MARLRRARYLSCFYCGRRTSIVFDGSMHQFTCSNCDATNYLDKNGGITDPPTSTTAAAETTTPFFASGPEPFHDSFGSPGSVSTNGGYGSPGGGGGQPGVFCKTCLKNQHLFVSSLAQYFPSDPNHPDTPELERKYFRFRQGLEQRYPQVCADCEPRVLDRIREAGYTAKTDHLRRMVDYSRQVRLTRATPLDAANWLGRNLWWAGLFLQILWQAGILVSFLLPSTSLNSTGDLGFDSDAIVDDSTTHTTTHSPERTTATALILLQPLLRLLVYKANFLRLSCIASTLASCWWNPFFVQTIRGFTKPLVGIPTWYAFQATIVITRLLLAKVVDYQSPLEMTSEADNAGLPPTVAGVHAVAAFFIFYLYTRAPRAIRKDVRPLFAKLPETPLTPQRANAKLAEQQHQLQQSENRRRGLETLSDVLDEISATPQRSSTSQVMQSNPLPRRDSDTEGWDGWRPSQTPRQQSKQSNGGWQAGGRDSSFGSLNLGAGYGSTTPASQPLQSWSQEDQYYSQSQPRDTDEMDWTPTQPSSQVQTQSQLLAQTPTKSPHRAFNTYEPGHGEFGQSSLPTAFSQTPVEADRGPFWYKVPPAPTSIAQRIFNRPNAPRLVKTGLGEEEEDDRTSSNSFFGQNGSPNERQRHTLDLAFQRPNGASSSVEFAQPSFFAEDFQHKGKKAGNGRAAGGQADNDDPGSMLSDLFSQTFTLGAGGEEEVTGGSNSSLRQRRASLHRRRSVTASPANSASITGRAASLMTTAFSLAAVYCLQDIATIGVNTATTTTTTSGGVSGADALVVQYVQPYARLIEATTVGLCAVLALSRTKESLTKWRRRDQRQSGGALSAIVGLLLGLASLALAAWMATQMWVMLQAGSQEQQMQQTQVHTSYDDNVEYNNGETYRGELYGWLDNSVEQQQQLHQNELNVPWQWWQLASLHGTVLAHQAWNMLVQ